MYKYASAVTDVGGEYLTSAIPYVNVANPVGTVAGLLEEPSGRKALDSMNKDKEGEWKSFIPGVGAYRKVKRLTNVHKAFGSESPRKKTINQMLGPSTQAVLMMLGGGLIGGYVGSKYADKSDPWEQRGASAGGFMAGAMAGLGTAGLINLTTAVAAAITDTRTDKEQEDATNQSSIKNYLVPGYGVYDYYKTLGKSQKM
jgi:outer membrane lipoprotein SlyB